MKSSTSIPWQSQPIECVVTDRTGGQTKILRSDYETTGAFPVIDQGKEFSNGFTSDESKLYRGNLPLVLFGDHTREIKFVDQRFALGADGVKLLEPKPILAAKFLYYFLLKSPVEVRGYSRHFKYLKEKSIPLPPLPEQYRIVEILDQADALRRQRRDADKLSQRILPALFHEMFGSKVFVGPKNLGDEGVEVRYGLSQPPIFSESGVAMIRATNISRGRISTKDLRYIDKSNIPKKEGIYLRHDEVIVVRSGAYTGDVAQVTSDYNDAIAGYDLILSPPRCIKPEFLEQFLLSDEIQNGHFSKSKVRGGQPHLNADQIKATLITIPPEKDQADFSFAVQSIRKHRKQSEISAARLETLFQTLLHRAFDGSLTAKWRESHAKELLQEMEHQAR